MRQLFNPEKGIWRFLGWLGDLLVLSLLWVVFSLPVVTMGASTAALYDSVAACFRREEQDYLGRFFRTFRREWKAAILPTLLWLCILGLSGYLLLKLISVAAPQSSGVFTAVSAVSPALFALPLGVSCWVFPLLSRFTLSFSALNGNAVRLALGHILRTFALALAAYVSLYLTWRLALLPLFLFPALFALFESVLMEPVFAQYERSENTD